MFERYNFPDTHICAFMRSIFLSLERAYVFPRGTSGRCEIVARFWDARPASQDRARIVFDCRMANDPAMMIDGFCTGEMDYKLPPNRS